MVVGFESALFVVTSVIYEMWDFRTYKTHAHKLKLFVNICSLRMMESREESRRPTISVGEAEDSYREDNFSYGTTSVESESLLSCEDRVFAGAHQRNMEPVTDRLNMAYIILYLQGVGSLLPWSFFITARGYFVKKFENEPDLGTSFESAFSVAAMVPNVLSLLVNVFLTKQVNRNSRIITCLVVTILCFIVTAVFVKVDTTNWTRGFFALTIGIVALINMACAIYGGAFFGVAGMIGQKYTQAVMGGQGLGGTFAAVASILSILGNSEPEESGFGYFLTAVAVTCVCFVSFVVFFRLEFVNYCLNRNEFRELRGSQATIKESINALTASSSSLLSVTSLGSTASAVPYPVRAKVPYLEIMKQLWPMAASVCLVFATTLSLFPSVVSGIESVNKADGSKWNNELFSPLICFLLFNLGDLAGRTIAGIVPYFNEKSCMIPVLCISRIVFLPLFALCNYRPDHRRLPVLLKHDAYPIFINTFFALSNGYLGSLCMMYGPKLVNPKYAEVAGTIMALFLSCGLALGAGLSFAVTALI